MSDDEKASPGPPPPGGVGDTTHLFEEAVRANSRRLLAIARAIVEGHGGEIDVQDRDDAPSGARFTLCLPAAVLT